MINLTLLHTNDIHGRIHQLSRIAGLVKQIRTEVHEQGGDCFWFDAGDAEDPTLLESCLTHGSAMDVIMKGAGCDQMALGNAIPIRYGAQEIENLARHFGKPLLCANLFDVEDHLFNGLIPYTIETIQGLKIGVIGLTAPMSLYASVFKIKPVQPVEIIPGIIHSLKKEGVKTIIILSHISSKADIELAEKVSGIDVIIGGHDHKRLSPPLQVNNTLIVQTGEYGQMLGRLDLVLDPRSGKVVNSHAELLAVEENLPEDDRVLRIADTEKNLALSQMQTKIGELLAPVECLEEQECAAGNLLADALLEHVSGAQIAFIINGHWTTGLNAGTVTQLDLYSANRSSGNPALCEITGAQIEQFLKAALIPENIKQKIKPLRGRSVGMPHISGMRVEVEKSDPDKITIYIQDRKIKPEEHFMAASSDIEFSDFLGYLEIPDEQIAYEAPTVLPQLLEEYIIRHSPIKEIQSPRIIYK